MKEIYALGVGHNTCVFIDLAEACGYTVLGLFHFNSYRTGDSDHGHHALTKDVPPNVVMVGSLARILREIVNDENTYYSDSDDLEMDFFEM